MHLFGPFTITRRNAWMYVFGLFIVISGIAFALWSNDQAIETTYQGVLVSSNVVQDAGCLPGGFGCQTFYVIQVNVEEENGKPVKHYNQTITSSVAPPVCPSKLVVYQRSKGDPHANYLTCATPTT